MAPCKLILRGCFDIRSRCRLPPPHRRRLTNELLERAAERRFRFITNGAGDDGHVATVQQQAGGNLHPPQRQILHRGVANHLRESLREDRPRDAHVARELLDRPRLARLRVQRGQSLSDDRVAQSREPTRLGGRKSLEVLTDRLDEEQLRKPRPNIFAARTRASRLFRGHAEERGQPSG
jgi:hypothetical protein